MLKHTQRIIVLVMMSFIMVLIPICAQEYDRRADLLKDLIFDDTDVVIMNGERYLINKSLLINFKGYKDLFPESPKIEAFTSVGTSSTDFNMPYTPFWVIDEDKICLIGINLNSDYHKDPSGSDKMVDLSHERFTRIEKLVGKQFEKGLIPESLYDNVFGKTQYKIRSIGAMQATWANGIYYIKPIYGNGTSKAKLAYEEWGKKPILKLTIKDGKIIKTEEV